jgi:hypothetical protein
MTDFKLKQIVKIKDILSLGEYCSCCGNLFGRYNDYKEDVAICSFHGRDLSAFSTYYFHYPRCTPKDIVIEQESKKNIVNKWDLLDLK